MERTTAGENCFSAGRISRVPGELFRYCRRCRGGRAAASCRPVPPPEMTGNDYLCHPIKYPHPVMTISYNWLCEYLPVTVQPEKLSHILTAVGLEVESMERFESVKGGLRGLVIGEVLTCGPHPNADKLKLTLIDAGGAQPQPIVCGASNVAAGQKVVVAVPGTTIYPMAGDPVTLKVATIRGVESHGMICAEDEIGLGSSHAGILVLPADAPVGMAAADWFQPFSDIVFEIGLTPNHMDAMSHLGVARDVCAWLAHHENGDFRPRQPSVDAFRVDSTKLPVEVRILNPRSCERYSGVSIAGIRIGESPRWLQDRLRSIGVR